VIPMAAKNWTISADVEHAKAGDSLKPKGTPVHLRKGGVRPCLSCCWRCRVIQLGGGEPVPCHLVSALGSRSQLTSCICLPSGRLGNIFRMSTDPKDRDVEEDMRPIAALIPPIRNRHESKEELTPLAVKSLTTRTGTSKLGLRS
jgi:hypothetical protein